MKSDTIRTLLVLAAFAAAGTSFAAEPAAGIPAAIPAAQGEMIAGGDGTKLYLKRDLPDGEIRAVLVIVHGLANHHGLYDDFVKPFGGHGIAVYRYDTRGHGRSEGRRGYVKSYWEMVDDLRAVVAVAAKRMNRTLGEEQLDRAAELLEQHCVEMNVKNATLFANFVVQLPLAGDETDIRRAVSMANSIRQWRDVEPGDPLIAEVEAVVKDEAIDDLASYLGPGNAAHFAEPNPTLFNTFQLDLGRATVVIGDRIHEVNRTNVADAIADFKNALAGKPNAQKAVSSLMHQGLAMHTMRLRIKMGLVPTERRPNPLASYAQPGAEKFVNRTGNPELFPVPTILENPTSRYELHVSDDGNTATVRLVWSGGINVGVELKPDLDTIGSVDVIEEITLDLTNDNPRITNVRLGQKISA